MALLKEIKYVSIIIKKFWNKMENFWGIISLKSKSLQEVDIRSNVGERQEILFLMAKNKQKKRMKLRLVLCTRIEEILIRKGFH